MSFLKRFTVEINETSVETKTEKKEPYYIIRATHAGVFAANIEHREGQTFYLKNARRIWYWAGAASLSELAVRGVKLPLECKFPVEMPELMVFEVIEVISCSDEAEKSIKAVPEWKA